MKPWTLEELEKKRNEKLTPLLVSLQSSCRGYLARRKLEQMKVKDVAVRCVQKNVRKLLAVRNWSWWKMYQQIAPLIKVQSSHEKLQSAQVKRSPLSFAFSLFLSSLLHFIVLFQLMFVICWFQDELASIKIKYEKAEGERNRLKLENENLHIRVRTSFFFHFSLHNVSLCPMYVFQKKRKAIHILHVYQLHITIHFSN